MKNWISLAGVLCLGVSASADTFTATIVLPSGPDATPGAALPVEVHGLLTTADPGNDGLCFFSVDLALTGPQTVNLSAVLVLDPPADGTMNKFVRPLGFDGGYGGVAVGDEVVQAGGAQNTIGNNPAAAPFLTYPSAEFIDLNVAHTAQLLLVGTLTLPQSIAPGTYTLSVESVLANVLSDGQTSTSFGTYTVETVTPIAGAPVDVIVGGAAADLNGDGHVDAADLAILLGSWGPCPQCAADLNGDGHVNAADLAQLLGSWG